MQSSASQPPAPSAAAPAVLVTRPHEAAEATAARLQRRGYRPVLAPLLDIRPLPCDLPDPADIQAVLVTSARALPALPPAYHAVRLLAVGTMSAERARSAGHVCVESADGDASDLARLVLRRCEPAAGTLLLLSGRGEGAALTAMLRPRFVIDQRFVYAAEPARTLPVAAASALRAAAADGSLAAALFFSAATARTFVTLAEAAGLRDTVTRVDALAISAPTAAALAPLPWRAVRVALRPNQEELLALLP